MDPKNVPKNAFIQPINFSVQNSFSSTTSSTKEGKINQKALSGILRGECVRVVLKPSVKELGVNPVCIINEPTIC